MATKPRYEFEVATQLEIDAALRPFFQRFVVAEKRERVLSLFSPLRKRARPRDLVDAVDASAVLHLDGSARAEKAFARLAPQLEGILITGKPAAFRIRLSEMGSQFAYSDEELFIARDGGSALFKFEIGDDWLILPTTR